MSVFCAGVDWGTSSFRLWLLDEDGTVRGERRSREGMQTAGGIGFATVLESHLAALGASPALPVIVCGMAGARQGWIEAPYVDAPAALDAIAQGAIKVPGIDRDVRILPGVAQRTSGRPDVMRGEETQVMGLSAGADALVCLPGTHSKWVALEAGRIAAFSTFMTGEVYALLAAHSILRHAVAPEADALARRDAFAAGVEASLTAPELILNRLFALRAAGLFGAGDAEECTSRLSGLVIGLELAGVRALHPLQRSVTLAASGTLLAVYRQALAISGWTVEEADADAAVRAGLLAAARHCFAPDEGSR